MKVIQKNNVLKSLAVLSLLLIGQSAIIFHRPETSDFVQQLANNEIVQETDSLIKPYANAGIRSFDAATIIFRLLSLGI